MTEAGWTSEKPTAEGWYWRKFLYCHVEHVEVCRVQKFGEIGGELGVWERGAVKDLTGLWLGPISPDSYQQGRVDSLEKQVEELEMEIKRRVWLSHGSRMKHLLYGDDGKMDCNSCGRDYAAMPLEVAQRYELDDAIKLAQQAQDEKGVGE